MDQLMDQARLAHAGLAHERQDPSPPSAGVLQGLPQLFHLSAPPDETSQTPSGSSVEARLDRACASDLVDRDWLGQAFHRDETARIRFGVAFSEPPRVSCRQDASGTGEL